MALVDEIEDLLNNNRLYQDLAALETRCFKEIENLPEKGRICPFKHVQISEQCKR